MAELRSEYALLSALSHVGVALVEGPNLPERVEAVAALVRSRTPAATSSAENEKAIRGGIWQTPAAA